MAKTRKQKEVILKEYKVKLKDNKGFIVLKPTKVTVNESNSLKKDLFDSSSEYHVIKNNIFKIALKDAGLESLEANIKDGEYSAIFIKEDPVTPARVLKKFLNDVKLDKTNPKVEIIFGVLEGTSLDKAQVIELSEMPDKKGSIAMILGILDMAISGVVNVLEDAPRGIVSVLDQAFKE